MNDKPNWQVAHLDDIERRGRDIPVREHLGIHPLGPRREPHQVGEQHRQDLPLLPRRRNHESGAAGVAEPRAFAVLCSAGRAHGHAPSLGRSAA